MSILETVGALIVGLLLIAAAAFGLYSAFGKSNVATTEQNLVLLRMQTQQLFFGTNYDNLDNDVAMSAGIVPKAFIKGDSMKNAWGGDVTLANDADNGQFSITLDNVPQDACSPDSSRILGNPSPSTVPSSILRTWGLLLGPARLPVALSSQHARL